MQKVKEVMIKEVISVRRSTTISELLNLFKDFHTFPLVPVVEKDNSLVGVVSFKNIIEIFHTKKPQVLKTIPFLDEEKVDIFKTELSSDIGQLVIVEDIMETKFVSVEDDKLLEEAYRLMELHQDEHLPVVDIQGILVGIIGIFDIVKAIFRQKDIIK